MPSDERPPSQAEAMRSSLQLAFKVLAQVGLLTAGVIMVAVVGGILLDRVLNTRPLFTVLLLVGSFPASLYIIYRVALGAVAPAGVAGSPRSRAKEEQSSDDGDA